MFLNNHFEHQLLIKINLYPNKPANDPDNPSLEEEFIIIQFMVSK